MALAVSLAISGNAFGNGYTGVNVQGCCYSTGQVASAMDMNLLYTGIVAQHTAWTEKVVAAILAGAKSVQGAEGQSAKAQLNAQAAQQAIQINAQAKIDSANRNIFETPVSNCQNSNFGYYFTMNGILGEDAIGRAVAMQRDIAGGITEDMNKRDLLLGALAKYFDQHGFLFPGVIYTEGQQRAAGDAFDLLLPDWKNPRPKNMSGVEDARYRIMEARVRIMRSVLAKVWYDFTFERTASVPAKEIYQVLGPTHTRFFVTDYSKTIDEKTGLSRPNVQPKKIEVGPEDNISQRALFEIPFMYYTTDGLLKVLGAKGASAVLKEEFRLMIYMYAVMNEIRKNTQMANLLKALQLLQSYSRYVSMTENQVSR